MLFPVSLSNLTWDCKQNGWVDSGLASSYAQQYPEVPFPTAVSSLPPVVVDPRSSNLLGLTVYNPDFVFNDLGKSVSITAGTYKLNSLGVRGEKLAVAPGITAAGTLGQGNTLSTVYKNVDISSAFFMRDSSSVNPGPGTTRDLSLYIRLAENSSGQRVLELPPLICRVLFSAEF